MKTLKTLVLETATVTGVKLATPADRIGLGLGVVLAYPMDNLSQGLFPMPHNPEPEQVRSRQVVRDASANAACERRRRAPGQFGRMFPWCFGCPVRVERCLPVYRLAKDDANGGDRQKPARRYQSNPRSR